MPPSFASARRRTKEQIASTTEPHCVHSISFGRSFLVFSCLWSSCHSSVLCVLCDFVSALVHVFHTYIHQHQIQDSSQNIGSHNFCSHGRTGLHRYCNLTGCRPLVRAHTFDHNTTSFCSICLCADIQKTSNCLQVFCIVTFLNYDLSLPLRASVRKVVGLLIVLSEDVLHEIVVKCHWIRNFPLPPRMQCFCEYVQFYPWTFVPSRSAH